MAQAQPRTGLLARKIGMTRLYNQEDGTGTPVTVLAVENCTVTGQCTDEQNGYTAVQLGIGTPKLKNVAKPQKEAFAKLGVAPKSTVCEFRIVPEAQLPLGAELLASHFVPGQFVDVSGITIGKGFAGAMKRHNFGGLRASHGVSISHRSHGSTGQRQDPGKVFKGKKMAGHMGHSRVTKQNLLVSAIDEERGLILVRGAVPGAKGTVLEVRDAVKKKVKVTLPFPAQIRAAVDGAAPAAAVSDTPVTEQQNQE